MKHLLYNKLLNIFRIRYIALFGILCFLFSGYITLAQEAVFPLEGHRGCYEVMQAYDGGNYIVNVSEDHSYAGGIVKLNRKGEQIWEIAVHPEDSFLINGIDELSNGDIIVSGETMQYWSPYIPKNSKVRDGVLARINTCGEVEWVKIIVRDSEVKLSDPVQALLVDNEDNIWVNHAIHVGLDQDLIDTYGGGNRGVPLTISKFNADGELLNRTEEFIDVWGRIWQLHESLFGGVMVVGYGSFLPYYNQVESDTNNLVYDRSLVMKIDEECEIEWYDVYDWENDEPFDLQNDIYTHFIKVSRTSSILEKLDSNSLILGNNIFYDTNLSSKTYNLLLYELDQYGNLLRDTIYEHNYSVGYSFMEFLNDSTIVLVTNAFPLDDIYGDKHLEVWKININTFHIEDRFVDTIEYAAASRIEVSDEGKILVGASKVLSGPPYSETRLLVINPETMTLDSVPLVDTNTYDYLCNGVFSAEFINLPEDTATYEPIGVYEYIEGSIEIGYFSIQRQLYIDNSTDQNVQYTIVNNLGQVVKTGDLPKEVTTITVADLPSGPYHIKLQTADHNTRDETFVIQ